MSTFTQFLLRELGKNTGKVISNIVFGDKHSTPYRVKIQREKVLTRTRKREDRKRVLEESRVESRYIKEEERNNTIMMKEKAIADNAMKVNAYNDKIDYWQSFHKEDYTPIDFETIISSSLQESKHTADEDLYREAKTINLKFMNEIVEIVSNVKGRSEAENLKYKNMIIGHTEIIEKRGILSYFSGDRLSEDSFNEINSKMDVLSKKIAYCQLILDHIFNNTKLHIDTVYIYLRLLNLKKQRTIIRENLNTIELQLLYNGLMNKHYNSAVTLVLKYDLFEELANIAIYCDLSFSNGGITIKIRNLSGTNILPRNKPYTISNGEVLKTKALSAPEINLIYQNALCSMSIRAAQEIFALLQLDKVKVDVYSPILNTLNGKREKNVVLSVIYNIEDFHGIIFDKIEPVEFVKSFSPNINFTKKSGFKTTESLQHSGDYIESGYNLITNTLIRDNYFNLVKSVGTFNDDINKLYGDVELLLNSPKLKEVMFGHQYDLFFWGQTNVSLYDSYEDVPDSIRKRADSQTSYLVGKTKYDDIPAYEPSKNEIGGLLEGRKLMFREMFDLVMDFNIEDILDMSDVKFVEDEPDIEINIGKQEVNNSDSKVAVEIDSNFIFGNTVSEVCFSLLQYLVDSKAISYLKLPWGSGKTRYYLSDEPKPTHKNGKPFNKPVTFNTITMESHLGWDAFFKILSELCGEIDKEFVIIRK